MQNIALTISHLSKTYASGTQALSDVSLEVQAGEVFSLLGPNGAGKTTLIGIIAGIVEKTSGEVSVFGKDIVSNYRDARSTIGYVPQEMTLNPFDTVWDTLRFQRGFFGRKRNDALLEEILSSLSLWDKRDQAVRELSGGMKRRVLIAKALTNEPKILFLDEPSAGVDVELRRGMWEQIRRLKEEGVTIILTTHYIEEAEEMADRVGVINNGKLIVVEETKSLIARLGDKELAITLAQSILEIPARLERYQLTLSEDGTVVRYKYQSANAQVEAFFDDLQQEGVKIRDIETKSRSLEDIFLSLIEK